MTAESDLRQSHLDFRTEWKLKQEKKEGMWLAHWIACGGTREELDLVYAQRDVFQEIYRRGPTVFGELPPGCRETSDVKFARNIAFDRFKHSVGEMIYAGIGPVRCRRLDLGFTSPLKLGEITGVLPTLWMLQAELVPTTLGPLWWSRELAPSIRLFWGDLLDYCWILATPGGEWLPLIDNCLAAFASGRLPVAYEGDTVLAYAITPELMQTQVKKEQRRRAKHSLPAKDE